MNKLTDSDKIEIVRLYQTSMLTSNIAAKFGITTTGVRKILKVRNIPLRCKSKWKKYIYDEHFLDNVDSEEKAYFLGFLYADGNFYPRYRKISIEISDKDEDILFKIKKILKSNHKIGQWFRKGPISGLVKRYVNINLCGDHFSSRCNELGVVPQKSKILKFPNHNQVPDKLIRHFIRGYFDGDGSLSYKPEKRQSANVSIISSVEFCKSLESYIHKNVAKIGTYSKNNQSEGMAYFRMGGNPSCLTFLKWMYDGASIFLDRKYSNYKFFSENYPKTTKFRHKSKINKLEEVQSLDFSD